ncbi:MAG: helix-turn-helix domain-containing protein [Lachnospiraceae bacterium]|nr:helix-turn-helix domain-containing protein [Lachnospiraceae bacterium]
MKNPKIAEVLRYYRKINGYSVNDVAGILTEQKNSVAAKTVYGWENGTTQPDADTLMFLCELYRIPDVLQAFGYGNKDNKKGISLTLTPKEIKLVEGYRKHTQMQEAVDRLLNLEN